MFPGLGRIHVAPFSDEALYSELQGKAAFWLQPDFYGVDISCLHAAALKDYFSQVSHAGSGDQIHVQICAGQLCRVNSDSNPYLAVNPCPLRI